MTAWDWQRRQGEGEGEGVGGPELGRWLQQDLHLWGMGFLWLRLGVLPANRK